jgi:GDP-L-fucose synthase
MPIHSDSKIFVAGHRGMVGSAVVRALQQSGYKNIITRTRSQLNLLDQLQVKAFFEIQQVDYVVAAAARVGGIHANNSYPAQFIYENLMIECNLIHQAYKSNVKDLLFLGSSCIYPKMAEQPMTEDALLSGKLEPTNEPYAIAKIAGIKLCESYNREYGTDYRSLMPTNLYGSGDSFDLEGSHVIPALIRKFHEAKMRSSPSVEIWGSGNARREFLHVDDLANAILLAMQLPKARYASVTTPMQSQLNVGTGEDITIKALANQIRAVVGFEGELTFNAGYPDGTPRKLMQADKLNALGWRPRITLDDGLRTTYEWFKAHEAVRVQA